MNVCFYNLLIQLNHVRLIPAKMALNAETMEKLSDVFVQQDTRAKNAK